MKIFLEVLAFVALLVGVVALGRPIYHAVRAAHEARLCTAERVGAERVEGHDLLRCYGLRDGTYAWIRVVPRGAP